MNILMSIIEKKLSIIGTNVEHNRYLFRALQHSIIGFLSIIGTPLHRTTHYHKDGHIHSTMLGGHIPSSTTTNKCLLRCVNTSTSIRIDRVCTTHAKKLQSGLNPDSPIHLPSRIQSGFRWIQLDFVGVWPQLSTYANA